MGYFDVIFVCFLTRFYKVGVAFLALLALALDASSQIKSSCLLNSADYYFQELSSIVLSSFFLLKVSFVGV